MIDIDVWVRGGSNAVTQQIANVPGDAAVWTDADVRALLTGMLLSLDRVKNPGGQTPEVSLRGFSWIVSSDEGGVLVHLEMQLGTASAGPFGIAEAQLIEMITRVIAAPEASPRVH